MCRLSIRAAPVLPEDVSGSPQKLFQREKDVAPGILVQLDQPLDQGIQPPGLGQVLQLLGLGVLKGLIQAVQKALTVLGCETGQPVFQCEIQIPAAAAEFL